MQLSLFDDAFANPLEILAEKTLLQGSGFENGKTRILEFVRKNPTIQELADFLKDEYGTGGRGGPSRGPNSVHQEMHDPKGIRFWGTDNEGNEVKGELTWKNAAELIIKLIDEQKYLGSDQLGTST